MKISKNFIEKVLNATDIVELISDHGIVLKKTGVNLKDFAPFTLRKLLHLMLTRNVAFSIALVARQVETQLSF